MSDSLYPLYGAARASAGSMSSSSVPLPLPLPLPLPIPIPISIAPHTHNPLVNTTTSSSPPASGFASPPPSVAKQSVRPLLVTSAVKGSSFSSTSASTSMQPPNISISRKSVSNKENQGRLGSSTSSRRSVLPTTAAVAPHTPSSSSARKSMAPLNPQQQQQQQQPPHSSASKLTALMKSPVGQMQLQSPCSGVGAAASPDGKTKSVVPMRLDLSKLPGPAAPQALATNAVTGTAFNPNVNANSSEAVQVVVRVRGGKEASADTQCVLINPDQKSLNIADKTALTFDRVYDSNTQQSSIYQESALPLVNSFCDGFNASILAYVRTPDPTLLHCVEERVPT